MGVVTVDFVAREADESRWLMVLVEEGPWAENEIDANLRRVQDRLYGCIDAAIVGELAKKFPASIGKSLTVQVDFYDVPEVPVREFFRRFSEDALENPSYREALTTNAFVRGISFNANWRLTTGCSGP